MRAAHLALCALAVAAAAAPRGARAELLFGDEMPRVYTIEERAHLYSHELTLGGGVLPLNSFYVGLAPQISYTYHFSDLWAWEALGGFYSWNNDTGLQKFLGSVGQEAVLGSENRLNSIVHTNAVFRPLYGKMAVFNHGLINAQIYLTAGIGVALTKLNVNPAANAGIGLQFWLSQAFGLRFDVRDHFVFGGQQGGSNLIVSLAMSFNFNFVRAPSWRPPPPPPGAQEVEWDTLPSRVVVPGEPDPAAAGPAAGGS